MSASFTAADIPDTMRAQPAPLVVIGHGSVGIADICAPSMEHPDGFEKDWKALAYTLAGDGWLVVMPDFPGLGTEGAEHRLRRLRRSHPHVAVCLLRPHVEDLIRIVTC